VQVESLLSTLQPRFEKNMLRHQGMSWQKVHERLQKNPDKLWSLHEMERTGGEPDVVDFDKKTGVYVFTDCSPETPKGRVSLCYDGKALRERKENKPRGSAMELTASMGIEMLNEAQYRHLQTLGTFDAKTSSWIATPADIRQRGGALFCDYRYGHVFVYHNGAQSYYAARGFRGRLPV